MLQAMGTFADTNSDLWKYATGFNEPLFQFDLFSTISKTLGRED
jgi:hypothetical protein